MKTLKLKEKEKLTFVYQTVYNTAPVTFYGKAVKTNRFVPAICEKFKCSLQVSVCVSERKTTENKK